MYVDDQIKAAQKATGRRAPVAIVNPTAADVQRFGKKEVDEATTLADMLKTLKGLNGDLKRKDAEVTEFAKTATEQLLAHGKMSDEIRAKLEKAAEEAATQVKRITDLEQLVVSLKEARGANGYVPQKSLGAQVVESDEFKSMFEKGLGFKGRATFSKSITSATSGDGNAGELIVPQRLPGIIRDPERRLVVRDLLSQGRTTSNAIEYVRETGFTNSAAPVAEGAQKPESSLTFTVEQAPIRTIAHWIMASNQVLADVPMLQSYIDTRLRFGLDQVEEDQLLAGDGTGQNLSGLIPNSTPFDTSRQKVGDTRIDIVRRAMTQVRIAEYRATGIMLHPTDWEEIELLKDIDQRYIWANPSSLLNPTLWGLPVIDTTALEEGEFLVGAFAQAATIWDREDTQVDVSTEDRDNFIKNMVTIRAEKRLGLSVFRPEAIVYGDFDGIVST